MKNASMTWWVLAVIVGALCYTYFSHVSVRKAGNLPAQPTSAETNKTVTLKVNGSVDFSK